MDLEWRIFERANDVPLDVMTAQISDALGLADTAPVVTGEARLIAGLDPSAVARLDLSVDSDAMDGGVWLEPGCEDRRAREALGAGAVVVVTTFGQAG